MWWMRSSCARAEVEEEVEENQEVCMLYWHHGTGGVRVEENQFVILAV